MKKKILASIAFVAALLLPAIATRAQGTLQDYNRAYQSQKKFGAANVLYDNVNAVWLSGAPEFWYVRKTPEGPRYVMVNAISKKRTPLFNHDALAAKLAKASGQHINPDSISLPGLQVSAKGDTLRFRFAGNNWEFLTRKNTLNDLGAIEERHERIPHWMEVNDEKSADPVTSPDGTKVAFIRNANVYVRDLKTGAEKQLSIDGTDGNYSSSIIYESSSFIPQRYE